MSAARFGVEGVGEPSAVAERVDDWRRRFAPAGSTSYEKLWVTSVDGKSRSARPSEAAWERALAQLADGHVAELEWEPVRGEVRFPLYVMVRAKEGQPASSVAFNAVWGEAPPTSPDRSTSGMGDVLAWTAETVAALDSAIAWGDSVSHIKDRSGGAKTDVGENGVEALDESRLCFADAWWAMWISGSPLQRLGGVEAVLSGWPGGAVEDQSIGERKIVFTLLADTPEQVEHAVYLKAFGYLRPALAPAVEPRSDPAHIEESFELLMRGVPPEEWPEHLRPLAWPFLGTKDVAAGSPSHLGGGPTNEELRSAPMPGSDPELFATFKTIAQDDDGERIGPLIVSHPERGVLWESPEEMRETDARVLAEQRQWRYSMTT